MCSCFSTPSLTGWSHPAFGFVYAIQTSILSLVLSIKLQSHKTNYLFNITRRSMIESKWNMSQTPDPVPILKPALTLCFSSHLTATPSFQLYRPKAILVILPLLFSPTWYKIDQKSWCPSIKIYQESNYSSESPLSTTQSKPCFLSLGFLQYSPNWSQ